MRARNLLVLSAVLLLSVGVASGAASGKKKSPSAIEQMCVNTYGGAYSTRVNDSYFAPFYKKQGVVWVCNSYNGGQAATQALVQSCLTNDGGQATSTLDGPPGMATCWLHPPN